MDVAWPKNGKPRCFPEVFKNGQRKKGFLGFSSLFLSIFRVFSRFSKFFLFFCKGFSFFFVWGSLVWYSTLLEDARDFRKGIGGMLSVLVCQYVCFRNQAPRK